MKTLISDLMNVEAIPARYTPTVSTVETTEETHGIGKDFIFAGNATFTVEPSEKYINATECKPHYTYKVTRKEGEYNGRPQVTYFAALLTGPDNESDYSYMGILQTGGLLKLTKASKYGADTHPVKILERIAIALVEGRGEQIVNAGWKVHHEGRCGRCGRTLTTPESVERGIGPECYSKMVGA